MHAEEAGWLVPPADPADHESLLGVWMDVMMAGDATQEKRARMREDYAKDVAVLPPAAVVSLLESGGFEGSVQFYQAGLVHAWYSRRAEAGRDAPVAVSDVLASGVR